MDYKTNYEGNLVPFVVNINTKYCDWCLAWLVLVNGYYKDKCYDEIGVHAQ
jgi:hypothetical protein